MSGQPPYALLPLMRGVLFPNMTTAIPVGRPRTIELIRTLQPGEKVVVGVQKDPEVSDPSLEDLYTFATLASVQQIVRVAGGGYRIVLRGLERVRLKELVQEVPIWRVEVEVVEQTRQDDERTLALFAELQECIGQLADQNQSALATLLKTYRTPATLSDAVAAELGLDTPTRAKLLGTPDVCKRIGEVLRILSDTVTRTEVKSKIESEVRKEFGKNQREAILREQLRAIKRELRGSSDEHDEDENDALARRLEEAKLPQEVRKVAERELARLESINPAQAEHNIIRTYLEWILDVPWEVRAQSEIDLDDIARKLDADHDGLEEVKRRILEHMAVLKMAGKSQATILCLVGPPGVGKTSLAQSVADAIDRPLVRISLGGVRDEAEIRGHRRTYVGAMPGRFVHALKKAEVNNPVIVLDEIDKLTQSWMGSPEAALLEVLDPEQNATFGDHYLNLPLDLSNVLFICTANELGGISAPLRDRMEIIELSGYTPAEKVQIAKNHLLPKCLKNHGIAPGQLEVSDQALLEIVVRYTREAGVRQLGQMLTKLCRALTLELVRNPDDQLTLQVEPEALATYLGKPRFWSEVAARTSIPGVATGLAWTPMGGDILFIETTKMPGKGRIEATGQLGDVMKESSRAAMAYLRTNAQSLGIETGFLETSDIHIHIPAGAIPKDGPSAGVTMFTALTSLLTGRCVRPDTAMTGECSLRGQVLPVGGIKSKVLAAHRAGIKRVILPAQNEKDVEEIPQTARDEMEIIFATDMREVLAAALEDPMDPAVGLEGEEVKTEAHA